jgi:FkbM family methyltransferase
MAILTRKYYDKNGLFDPRFRNVYSDDDFTVRAKKAGAIVDARDITITHNHPEAGLAVVDETYRRGNAPEEYERAKAIFEAKHFPKIYSQNDEQLIIEKFFGDEPGILWDFGCNDGITLSNSHHLLKNKNWKGILVDASPVCVEKAISLYESRRDIQILNIGLGEKKGVLDFYESGTHLGKGDLSLVSSFKKESTQRWEPTTEYQVKKIQVYDFKSFIEDHARYKKADFITIDIEGLDFEILSSIDLDQTQTRLVCVEHNGHDIQKYIDYCGKFGMEVISQNAENLLMGKIRGANVRQP